MRARTKSSKMICVCTVRTKRDKRGGNKKQRNTSYKIMSIAHHPYSSTTRNPKVEVSFSLFPFNVRCQKLIQNAWITKTISSLAQKKMSHRRSFSRFRSEWILFVYVTHIYLYTSNLTNRKRRTMNPFTMNEPVSSSKVYGEEAAVTAAMRD